MTADTEPQTKHDGTTAYDLSRMRDRAQALEQEAQDLALTKVNGVLDADLRRAAERLANEALVLMFAYEERLGDPGAYVEEDPDAR